VEAPKSWEAAQAAIDREGAYGSLQIRQLALDDVNTHSSVSMRQRWGKDALTLEDCLDQSVSMWVCREYLTYWGNHYTKTTGKEPTYEVMSRMWNGGPQGWQRPSTDRYWSKVEKEILVHATHDCGLDTPEMEIAIWAYNTTHQQRKERK